MSISRLLLSSIVLMGSLPALAQSLPDSTSSAKLPAVSPSIASSSESDYLSAVESTTAMVNEFHPRAVMAPQLSACYSVRSYWFKRDDPESDAMKLSGYTTCTSASMFRTQAITESSK
jgi:hypothetical protein